MGMREMQEKAYQARDAKYLLIKAPPASGKSRALMYIALDKLANQGIKESNRSSSRKVNWWVFWKNQLNEVWVFYQLGAKR
jgi:hypothetical protein